MKVPVVFLLLAIGLSSCGDTTTNQSHEIAESQRIRILTLDPGHFHAALVQKKMYDQIDSVAYVYAPEGPEVQAHLSLIEQYNHREDNPTTWDIQVYIGPDFADKLFAEKNGNLVVLAGNNRLKTDYIFRSVEAGLNVLSDKPMAINPEGFEKLTDAFKKAEENNVLLYDIMTERSEVTNMLLRACVKDSAIFGDLLAGNESDPAIVVESVHHFSKTVSGKQLIRPVWFFDPLQEGESIADVGTHLVDLVQWGCFPDRVIDYRKDIQINNARLWPTPIAFSDFKSVTGVTEYPEFLKPYVTADSIFEAPANGEMNYAINGVHAKIIARWNFKAAVGGDSHFQKVKGSKATLEIRQTSHENFKPVLYIIPNITNETSAVAVQNFIERLSKDFPGVKSEKRGKEWKIVVPENLNTGHEAHFGDVMERFLRYLRDGKLPEWEVPNMIAKYYTTTSALKAAQRGKK